MGQPKVCPMGQGQKSCPRTMAGPRLIAMGQAILVTITRSKSVPRGPTAIIAHGQELCPIHRKSIGPGQSCVFFGMGQTYGP